MSEPPRLARWLVDRALPRTARGDAMRGDLLEEFRERTPAGLKACAMEGRLRAGAWYWRQALSIAIRYRPVHPRQPHEETRSMWLESIWHDTKHAVRAYAKAPSFTLAVVATLALGIGASTAIFSMVHGILLQPLPLPDPDRLVYVNEVNKEFQISVSWPNYLDWRERQHAFEGLASSREEPMTLTGRERAQRIRGRRVTGNFFRVLGIAPAIGRDFTDNEDRPEAAGGVMLTDGFWRRELGADPAAVGRILTLDGTAYTITGVMPKSFEFLRPYDAFVSMGPVSGTTQLRLRGNHNGYYAVGRLKPGVTLERAGAEMRAIAAALEQEHPGTNAGVAVRSVKLSDRFLSDIRPTLLALFGAVGFLLLIACVNVANLLIARGAARRHELAVRAALGGGRLRLIGQLLIESTLVAIAGGALGLAIASVLLQALVAAAPEGTPRITDVSLDRAALVFALGAVAVCGIVFGAFPALQASGVDGQHALIRGRAAGFSSGSHRLRRGLIVAESALALVLLAGAGLMIRTVHRLTTVETGFRPDHLYTARFTLAGDQWTHERRQPFFAEMLERLRAVPGVSQVALTYSLPIDGSQWNSIFIVADKPVPPRAELPSAAFNPVTADVFDTMGIRLLHGRTFSAEDTPASAPVIVINETLARRLWPGEDAVGKRLKQGWPDDKSAWREVIGVVADVKLNGVVEETPMEVYLPSTQDSARFMNIVARTTIEPAAVGPAIEATVRALNKDLPLDKTRSMDELLTSSIARQRMSVVVLVTFAAVALALAAVGVYGVVAHGVTERTHEIGVRMALGARARDVVGLIVRQGLSMVVLGTIVGVAGAFALSRSIEGLLFQVTATDPATFAVVVAVLLAVASAACALPAWRAARVDPTTALRSE